jgi:Family of unknown function (DUF6311)
MSPITMHKPQDPMLHQSASRRLAWLSSLTSFFGRDAAQFSSYILAIVIASCFVAYQFSWSFLTGNSTVFDGGDIAQHISGWWYYAKDSWHFPLLYTERLNHPEGVSIALTDSIPLMAMLFKALLTLFPGMFSEHFHYFGWWIGLVFVAQAISAVMLMRALGAKSWFALIISIGFALTWPVIHARYHHAALMMQSVIIFALAFYFLGSSKTWSSHRTSIAFVVLSLVALTIHPYFLPFVAGLFVAFMVDQIVKEEPWLLQLKRLLAFGIAQGVIMWLLGYLDRKAPLSGFGDFFFLDLTYPFCGGGKLIKCGIGPVYAFPYHEGFNYLGAGLLLLIPFALIFNGKSLATLPKKYPALLLLVLGFFLYALSNRVRYAGVEIFSYPLPTWLHFLTGTFRASGRFFWLVGLFILFVTLASLLKKRTLPSTLVVTFLLTTALVLQVKDVRPWLDRIKTEAAKPSKLNFADWASVMARVDKLVMYPTYQCAHPHYQHYIWVMQMAGYYGKLLNSGYVARSSLNCNADKFAIGQPFLPRHLYVLSSAVYANAPFTPGFEVPAPFEQAMKRGECVRRIDDMICLPGSTAAFWNNIEPVASLITMIDNGRQWGVTEYSTVIGKPVGKGLDQRLVPRSAAEAGWLSFGPFLALPTGKYRYSISYSSNISPEIHTGNWEIVLENEKILKSGKLIGTQGQPQKIEGIFSIEAQDAGKPFELRTFYLAKGDLQIINSSLQIVP